MLAAANATFDRTYRAGIGPTTAVGVLSKWAIAGTTLGRVDATRFLVPNQMRALRGRTRRPRTWAGRPLANRSDAARRTAGARRAASRPRRGGAAARAAAERSRRSGGESIIRLFPAWPDEWDAQFTLRARGGFVVTASKRGGRVESVQLRSEAGSVARVRNPWGTQAVTVSRNGKRSHAIERGYAPVRYRGRRGCRDTRQLICAGPSSSFWRSQASPPRNNHQHELHRLQASTSSPRMAIASPSRMMRGFTLFAGVRPLFALSTARKNDC